MTLLIDYQPATQTCTYCGLTKPLSGFYRNPGRAIGVTHGCKECIKARVARHRHEHRDAIRAAARLAHRRRVTARTDWSRYVQLPLFIVEQRCLACGVLKPLEDFQINRARASGRCTWCRACMAARQKQRYAMRAAYYRALARARYAADPERHRRAVKIYARRHPERVASRLADYRGRNRERLLCYKRTRYALLRVTLCALARDYARAHRAECHARERAWRKEHPEASKARYHRQRARRREAPGRFTGGDVARIYEAQRGRCFYCAADLAGQYHIEHRRPISRGGSNWPDNIVCSCSSCNLRKGILTDEEFRQRLAGVL